MGIFGKKKDSELEGLHNENLFNDDDDIFMPSGSRRNSMYSIGRGNTYAPHALTADEVVEHKPIDEIKMEHPQPDSVYKRMMEREKAAVDNAAEDNYVPSWAIVAKTERAEEPTFKADSILKENTVSAESNVAVADAVAAHTTVKEPTLKHSAASDAFLEKCRTAVAKASGEAFGSDSAERGDSINTYEPVSYTVPEASTPKTRSVDEIIGMLKGNAMSGNRVTKAEESIEKAPTEELPTEDAPVIAETETKDEREKEIKVEVEVIPTDKESDIMRTTRIASSDGDVRIYGKVVKGAVLQHTPDGDIDISKLLKDERAAAAAEEKTIMFDNLGDIISKRAESDADTYGFDDGNDDDGYYDDEYGYEDTPYYETEDERLKGIDDYKSLNDAARLKTRLADENSRNKTLAVFSTVATAIGLIFAIPFIKLPASTVGFIDLIILTAVTLFNYDVFKDFKNFAAKRPSFDSCVALASAVTLIQCAVSTFFYDGKYAGFAIAATLLMTFERYSRLMRSSRVLKGLEIIATSQEKHAVMPIGGSNGATVASGAVDGEAMVLCGRSAVNIKDYLKKCGYDSPFEHKLMPLFITAAVAAVIAGFVSGYFRDLGLGLTVASAVLLCAFPTCAAFVCELPMYFASKKNRKYGAAILGYKGAYELNLANIAAVTSSDLFPESSVTLYNMKPLGENEIGRTLIDAGAVAAAAGSPLAPLFKQIIGKDAERQYPKVNGVQYEDKMGISGWIGERTVLIGNRNLLQGHNVSVPAAAVDQKVLRAGYFPVYIAIDGHPCLLLVVKYEADEAIAHELSVLCNTGMTLVVDPKDPNVSSDMICDYYGLPNDAVKVMNHNGRTLYEQIATPADSLSPSATYGKDICGFFSAITSAITLNGTYAILKALFIICASIGALLLVYFALSSKLALVTSLSVAAFQLVFAAISAIAAKVGIDK